MGVLKSVVKQLAMTAVLVVARRATKRLAVKVAEKMARPPSGSGK